MDILLIDPPYKALKGIGSAYGYSINTVSLAAYLREGGFDSAVLTGNLLLDLPVQETFTFDIKKYAEGQRDYEKALGDEEHEIWQKISFHIRRLRPQAIGITCVTPAKDLVDKLASVIKSIDRDMQVITGGHHPTFCTAETLINPNIDFVIRGEGEIPLLRLIQEFQSDHPNFNNIPNLSYRKNGKIIHNSIGDMIQDLDRLPLPARDLVIGCDYSRYKSHYIATSRGCPYSCRFCSDRRLWQKTVRRRSIENVIQEIRHINDTFDVNFIDFVDGTFTYDSEYTKQFCLNIIEQKIQIKWRCTARYDNINEEMLDLMKRANCAGLYFGLESGSERILKSVNKKLTVDKIIKTSELVAKSGIGSITAVLIGLPNEEKSDIESTLSLMQKIKTDVFDINCYVPLPGTELYDNLDSKDRNNINWRKVGFKSFDSYFTKKISRNDLAEYIREAYDIAENTQKKFQRNGGWHSKAHNT